MINNAIIDAVLRFWRALGADIHGRLAAVALSHRRLCPRILSADT